jgi:hypothetical protein
MSIHAPSKQGFQSLLRIAASSIADPPWLAAPVEAEEDQDSITVIFHVPEKKHGPVRVEASDQSVTLWGSRTRDGQRPMAKVRACPTATALGSLRSVKRTNRRDRCAQQNWCLRTGQ